jgi:hypothetical protein
MLVVQPWACNYSNEKLRTIGARTTVSHCQHIWSIEPVFLGPELVFKGSSPNWLTSSSISLRASSLVHKPFYNSVENHAVIVAFFHKFYEILASFGAILQVQEQMNISHSRL